MITLKINKEEYYFQLDMFSLSQFMHPRKIPVSKLGELVDDFYMLYELFYEAVQRGQELKGKTFTVSLEDFGKDLAANPKEFNKAFTEFLVVQESLIPAVKDSRKKKLASH
jgi:hypothetical protein